MCRWLAYSGSPILLEELLYKPEHSLIDQSLHARLGVETTNGDGFGVGWYDANTPIPAPSSGASSRLGTTAICAKSPATSSHRSFWRTSAPRPERPSSRPTATRSAMADGSGFTTASCATSRASSVSSHSP